VEEIRSRSGVLHPGCDFAAGGVDLPDRDRSRPPLIIWNHRWEFDKQPDLFFAALDAVRSRGRDFELALLGENFQFVPKEFLSARDRLGGRILQYGFVADRGAYIGWLRRGSIVISTAVQENFGIAVVEAIRHGCIPLLPNRLSYPELLEERFHDLCLYDDEPGLIGKLDELLADPDNREAQRRDLSASMTRFSWDHLADAWDAELDRLADSPRHPS
jgi:glycosyltransferase involved in cell wall biosynthesis